MSITTYHLNARRNVKSGCFAADLPHRVVYCEVVSPLPHAFVRACALVETKSTMQVFTDGLEVMSNMGAVVNSLFSRVQKNLVQTI